MRRESDQTNDRIGILRVFISYAREDAEVVKVCADALRDLDVEVFIDTLGISPGESWPTRLAHEIDESDGLVLIATQSSLRSDWVRKEVFYGDRQGKPIIPWVAESRLAWPNDFDFVCGSNQRIHLDQSQIVDQARQLVTTLKLLAKDPEHFNRYRRNNLHFLIQLEAEIRRRVFSRRTWREVFAGSLALLLMGTIYLAFSRKGQELRRRISGSVPSGAVDVPMVRVERTTQ